MAYEAFVRRPLLLLLLLIVALCLLAPGTLFHPHDTTYFVGFLVDVADSIPLECECGCNHSQLGE